MSTSLFGSKRCEMSKGDAGSTVPSRADSPLATSIASDQRRVSITVLRPFLVVKC